MQFKKIGLMILTGLMIIVTTAGPVSAASLSELKQQEDQTQKSIDTINGKIQSTLTKVNTKYQEVDQLKTKITENEEHINKAETILAAQKKELAERKDYAKAHLQALQKSEDNRDVLNTLLSADSLSDLFSRVYTLTILQDADNQNMTDLATSYQKMVTIQKHLEESKAALDKQKKDLDQQTADLQKQVDQMKKDLSQSQKQLADISKKKIEEQKREAEEQAKAAAKAKNEAAAKAASQKLSAVNNQQQAALAAAAKGKPGQTIEVQATAYSTAEPGLSRYGATGIDLVKNPNCIAVDPKVIPLNSLVLVPGYGYAIAGDTGGAIKGHIIDVHFTSVAQCVSWGRRHIAITIIK